MAAAKRGANAAEIESRMGPGGSGSGASDGLDAVVDVSAFASACSKILGRAQDVPIVGGERIQDVPLQLKPSTTTNTGAAKAISSAASSGKIRNFMAATTATSTFSGAGAMGHRSSRMTF